MRELTMCFRFKPIALILLLSLSLQAKQERGEALRPELALQISNLDFEIPAFDGGSGGMSNFARIPSWQPSANEATVTFVNFKIRREAEIVVAQLIVQLDNEKEVLVATYRLRENDTVRTEELTKFGVEPLALKVVKAKPQLKDPALSIQPRIENKTTALEVVGFFKDPLPSESYRLTLKNVSTKKIMALDLFMPSTDGNGGSGLRSYGAPGHPVMLRGDVFVHSIDVAGGGGRMTADGFVPDVQLQRTLIIRTVVFDDGTYDGEVEPAAEMEARHRGQDIQRKRIIPLLQRAIHTENQEALLTMNDLKESSYALDKTADTSLVEELMARYPALNKNSRVWLTEKVKEGMREGKLEFLRYVKEFEDTQKQGQERSNFQEWLKKTKANYESLTD